MGIYAGEILNLDLPQSDKRLYTIMETDGCAADGVAVATNCWVGRRTMRVEDYGKVAATFRGHKNRRSDSSCAAFGCALFSHHYAPEAKNKWEAQLLSYQQMPNEMLFMVSPVQLRTPIETIISHAGVKAICGMCGEEIMNEREVIRDGVTLCKSCMGESHYQYMFVSTASSPATHFILE